MKHALMNVKVFGFSRNRIEVRNTFSFSLFPIKVFRKLLALHLMKSYIWFCFRSTFLKRFFWFKKGIMTTHYWWDINLGGWGWVEHYFGWLGWVGKYVGWVGVGGDGWG